MNPAAPVIKTVCKLYEWFDLAQIVARSKEDSGRWPEKFGWQLALSLFSSVPFSLSSHAGGEGRGEEGRVVVSV